MLAKIDKCGEPKSPKREIDEFHDNNDDATKYFLNMIS